ncbi:hypothetical protein Rvan_2202 [Rhodomicrobium vannielii ATCC 17100]|uniref:Uncharacterized protein n=2 Tax=Rhodomicrobium vannielii TaxID=1069 RepID=E3I366_RHOVT|nr:hypothetical protein Rvan_2202 [Rhodomicrobium vannielii ATCC 17100]
MKTLAYAAFGFALFGAAAALSSAAGAAEAPKIPAAAYENTMVQTVQYGRCRAWIRECRARWGFGPRFRRCMAIHGC